MNEEYLGNAFIMAFWFMICMMILYRYPSCDTPIIDIGFKVFAALVFVLCIYYILVAFGLIPHFLGRI